MTQSAFATLMHLMLVAATVYKHRTMYNRQMGHFYLPKYNCG